MRCTGEDSGCCTKDTPCDIGEGDCDYNYDCKGDLICGVDNCPWGDKDDCCVKGRFLCYTISNVSNQFKID